MSDLWEATFQRKLATIAYGKIQSLTEKETFWLYDQVVARLSVRSSFAELYAALESGVEQIRNTRARGMRDEHQGVMTHEEWQALRQRQLAAEARDS